MEEATEVGAVIEEDASSGVGGPLPEADDALGRIERIIESVLFAAAAPVSLRRLGEILDGPTPKEVQVAIARLRQHYGPGHRGIQLHEVAGGYQLRTARENAEWVRAIFRDKPARLGRAALETLAIVAYKQPATRAEIEAIRGVDVDGVLSTLLSRRLIKITGRKEAVGRPLLYGTTSEFLEAFGLKDLNDLPSLKELGPAPDAEEPALTLEAADAAPETSITGASAETGACTAEPAGTPAEDSEPRGDCLAAGGGGPDPHGPRAGERAGRDAAGHEGGSEDRSDHD
jgi:segregation and condensation protein B